MSTRTIPFSSAPAYVTPQEVLQMERFKHLTEEQATELLHVIKTFCEVAYGIWQRQEAKQSDDTAA
jgi:hypothetical protein